MSNVLELQRLHAVEINNNADMAGSIASLGCDGDHQEEEDPA